MGYESTLAVGGKKYTYYSIRKAGSQLGITINNLPYTIRILLENALRAQSGKNVDAVAAWPESIGRELDFYPARILLQDFTGVPAIVDLASMRDAVVRLGGNASDINPMIPVDLVIDHSVQIDTNKGQDALCRNIAREFDRNEERYEFLKWAQSAFDNFTVIPPDTGIIHQINIEHLSPVIVEKKRADGSSVLYPDSVFGTDSHTTMVNGLGVLGWGVGGIEAEACMLGEPSVFPIPEVVGVRLSGRLAPGATATDLALKVTQVLREQKVVGKFIEYFGAGYKTLSLADRATIANMAPEYGATCGYCPIDEETIAYLGLTGRSEELISLVEAYVRENDLFYTGEEIPYETIIDINLNEISSNLSGPKRPQDLIALPAMKECFEKAISAEQGNQGFGLPVAELEKSVEIECEGKPATLNTGDVVLAAITSCTNTSNPSVLITAGLLARNAVERGLHVSAKVKTSFAPGSQAVKAYLDDAGLMPYLEKLGFGIVAYGCTSCIGNSGPLPDEISAGIKKGSLVVAGVLSGNRNFEGRIHPLVKANYLASPPLVVAYALAGNVRVDLTREPVGYDGQGTPVFLHDIWPESSLVQEYVSTYVTAGIYKKAYSNVLTSNGKWNAIETTGSALYKWNTDSTYIANPPFFDAMKLGEYADVSLQKLRVLAMLGDSITTDHISPAGNIPATSPAGLYLTEHGTAPADFNSYGTRRGNHNVMMRGTLANVRIRNKIASGKEGGYTRYWKTGEVMPIYDAAMKYKQDNTGLIILAGDDYGMGSSRDWAAKGVQLLGVRAVIARSYERIHRSNLVLMGVLPLQFLTGEDWQSLGLTGEEELDICLPSPVGVHSTAVVTAVHANGQKKVFETLVRFDSEADITYYRNGGILQMVIRQLLM